VEENSQVEERDPNLEMQQRYQNVFGTPEGRVVLGDILTMGHFGVTLHPDDPVEVAEYNFALVIAQMARALDLVYPQLGIPVREEN
jgi:hypothetical protein